MPAARSRVAVIFFTVLIDLIGFGIIIPILPYYAQRLGADGLGLGALLGVFSAMQFLATAFLGRTSDRVGRRPILLTTMLVNALGYLLFAAAHSYPVLFLARVVSGLAGGNISAAQAYMADITTPAERSRGMGMIGAAFGLGFIIGPALGGLSAHYLGPAAPGLVAAVLSLANFVSAYLVLPESLKAEHRSERQLWDFSHSIFGPAATGLVSVFADPTEQGTVLGAAQALAALGRLLGPLVMGEVYDVSRPAAFLVAGAVMALGGVVTLRVPKSEQARVAREQAFNG